MAYSNRSRRSSRSPTPPLPPRSQRYSYDSPRNTTPPKLPPRTSFPRNLRPNGYRNSNEKKSTQYLYQSNNNQFKNSSKYPSELNVGSQRRSSSNKLWSSNPNLPKKRRSKVFKFPLPTGIAPLSYLVQPPMPFQGQPGQFPAMPYAAGPGQLPNPYYPPTEETIQQGVDDFFLEEPADCIRPKHCEMHNVKDHSLKHLYRDRRDSRFLTINTYVPSLVPFAKPYRGYKEASKVISERCVKWGHIEYRNGVSC